MSEELKSKLLFVCALIEMIGRKLKQPRSVVVRKLGKRTLRQLMRDADILHCEPIEKVAEDYIEMKQLPSGTYDNVGDARYTVPDVWTIGKVYARLVEDIAEDDLVSAIGRVYCKWTDKYLSDYNLPVYYQPRDYIAACFTEKKILD